MSSRSITYVSLSAYLPFAIIHINILIPGRFTNSKINMSLMNTMGDILYFVVVIYVPDESSTPLVEHCFQYFLMGFVLCHLVVLDDESQFKSICIAMYKALYLHSHTYALSNFHSNLIVFH